MKRSGMLIAILCTMVLSLFSIQTFADTGPKPDNVIAAISSGIPAHEMTVVREAMIPFTVHKVNETIFEAVNHSYVIIPAFVLHRQADYFLYDRSCALPPESGKDLMFLSCIRCRDLYGERMSNNRNTVPDIAYSGSGFDFPVRC